MGARLAIFRLAAVAFLLLAGVELLACDLLSNSACEISRSFSTDGSGDASDGDGCLCCCCHIVVSTPFVLGFTQETVWIAFLPEPEPPSRQPDGIYHPPRP
ncbi:MAG: hypothetical protein Q8N47_04465 [Bryobacterales bacterium]|nr:hypothetical protein [Bryobacterales bacterium]